MVARSYPKRKVPSEGIAPVDISVERTYSRIVKPDRRAIKTGGGCKFRMTDTKFTHEIEWVRMRLLIANKPMAGEPASYANIVDSAVGLPVADGSRSNGFATKQRKSKSKISTAPNGLATKLIPSTPAPVGSLRRGRQPARIQISRSTIMAKVEYPGSRLTGLDAITWQRQSPTKNGAQK